MHSPAQSLTCPEEICKWMSSALFSRQEVCSGPTGPTTYLCHHVCCGCSVLPHWFGSIIAKIYFFDLLAQRDLDVLCFFSPPAVPGLPERCVSHLEKRCQPAGGCHPTRLWEHDVDQRPEELHLQRRWWEFLPTQNNIIFVQRLLK